MRCTQSRARSLFRLIEVAPVATITRWLRECDEGIFAEGFIPWLCAETAANDPDAYSDQLFAAAQALTPDHLVPLEHHAFRILALSEGRGPELVRKAMTQAQMSEADRHAFAQELDDYGRALWLFLHPGFVFDDAENLLQVDAYRQFNDAGDAYEIIGPLRLDFVFDKELETRLEARLRRDLKLPEACKIDYLKIPADGEQLEAHLILIRHAGELSSVAAMKHGRKRPLYYRPAIEATLRYEPSTGSVDVIAKTLAQRPKIARAFVSGGLGLEIDERSLRQRCYSLKRFMTSLSLDKPSVEGTAIEAATVVSITARGEDAGDRLTLEAAIGHDTNAIAISMTGEPHFFRRASAILKATISIRYTQQGQRGSRMLTLSITDPNRCNLRSIRDPEAQRLGEVLLNHWGLMRDISAPTACESAVMFSTVLSLFDRGVGHMSRRSLEQRGADIERLIGNGLISSANQPDATLELVREDGQIETVAVERADYGSVRYVCPESGERVTLPAAQLERFIVHPLILAQDVMRPLLSLTNSIPRILIPDVLTAVGTLEMPELKLPLLLARGLSERKSLMACDNYLRGDTGDAGVVLACGEYIPQFLGRHIVVRLIDVLDLSAGEVRLDAPKLTQTVRQAQHLARGATTVTFTQNRHSATLLIPGKSPLVIAGQHQIKVIERLYKAHLSGNPAVPTKSLLDGIESASLGMLFGAKRWKNAILGIYIGPAATRTRGVFQLLA